MSSIEPTKISCGVYQLWNLVFSNETILALMLSERGKVVASQSANINKDMLRWGCPERATNPETLKGIITHENSNFFNQMIPAIVLFSDADKLKNGTRFAEFIREFNLGKVIESDSVLNTNSGNQIKAFIWQPNKEAIKNWALSSLASVVNTQYNFLHGQFGMKEFI